MTDAREEIVEGASTKIAEVQVAQASTLPFSFYDKQDKRTTKLVASSGDDTPLEGRHRWYEYTFTEPVALTSVLVSVSGYSEFHEFEFRWTDVSGKQKRSTSTHNDGQAYVWIHDICKSVAFRPPSVYFSRTQVLSITIAGFSLESIAGAVDQLRQVDLYKERAVKALDDTLAKARAQVAAAEKANTDRTTLERESNQLKASISRSKRTLDDLSRQRTDFIAQNSAAEESLKGSQSRTESLNNQFTTLGKRHTELRDEVEIAEKSLKSLRENINLFPSEISGFVDQGSRNFRQYALILIVPVAIILVMFILLIRGAADLTTVVSDRPNVDIKALMISRVPYVAIATAIVTACYKIARVFISEMIKINSQRLSLTKMSIIAKDVSQAAEQGLNLTPEDQYRLRTDLKMQLLRDHLKDYLSKDFQLQLPRRLLGFIPLGKETVDAKVQPNEMGDKDE